MASDSAPERAVDLASCVANEHEPLPPELRPNIDHIVTETEEAVDNLYSEKQQRLLIEPLFSSWRGGDKSFVAMANVGLFIRSGSRPLFPT
ncbi:MAG: hypothetical protein CMJ64_10865 [Planctomycetaceae bacterium]|nr:hypothetical protein [Planctomycetaceae bacterium]